MMPLRFGATTVLLLLGLSVPAASSAQSYQKGVSVTLTIPTQQKITGVQDIVLGQYSGTGAFKESSTACIYNNTANGHYDIKVKGSGLSDAFTVSKSSNTIPYKVYWEDTTAKAEVTGPSATLSGRTGASSSLTCNSGTNATIEVEFAHNDLLKVPAGVYTGTLHILLVAPSS